MEYQTKSITVGNSCCIVDLEPIVKRKPGRPVGTKKVKTIENEEKQKKRYNDYQREYQREHNKKMKEDSEQIINALKQKCKELQMKVDELEQKLINKE